MALEIERKFLVLSEAWRSSIQRKEEFKQGYLANNATCSIRVRISGNHATLNIKSATIGTLRQEYDYSIPFSEGYEILNRLCRPSVIEKTRYYLEYGRHLWEIDEFKGDNEGLIIAEIELDRQDEVFEKPVWVGQEVSNDIRYYNVSLLMHPYKDW